MLSFLLWLWRFDYRIYIEKDMFDTDGIVFDPEGVLNLALGKFTRFS